MLKRIYIDNYKCCVNFSLEPDTINLLLGDNGSGKSTVFEVLAKLQQLICRSSEAAKLFVAEDLTRWQTQLIQRFELEIEGNNGVYLYELELEHTTDRPLVRISHERLTFNQEYLLDSDQGNVQLYHDDNTTITRYPFVWYLSAVASLPSRPDNTELTWFKRYLDKMLVVQINPMRIKSESEQETEQLDFQCENFPDWYRNISNNQGLVYDLTHALKEVIEGFQYFHFDPVGENKVVVKLKISDYDYRFHELSHGQRALLMLYTFIYYAKDQKCIVCIDEPENFVSLPEIQPWTFAVKKTCEDHALQMLIISHHPEYINDLADAYGLWFERTSTSHVRVRRLNDESGFELSELAARGWIHE